MIGCLTYGDLLQALLAMRKASPDKLSDAIIFIDSGLAVHRAACTEFNDGSLEGVAPYQLIISEV